MQLDVTQVSVDDVLGVRRAVLRPGFPPGAEAFPEDDLADTMHVAARDDSGAVVGVATFFPAPYEGRPAYQLRGMAVLTEMQGHGVGARLLEGAVELLRGRGVSLVWAHGRDSALGFYERQGWQVVGDGYEYGPMRVAHHMVVLALEGGD